MIKKIKGLGYLKLFKLLSSILLIGFFGLGVTSYVNAFTCTNGTFTKCPSQYFELGVSSTINDDYGNTFELLNGVNFLTNSDYKSFQVSKTYSNKQFSSTVYWNNNSLYVYNYNPETGRGLNMKIGTYCLGTTTNHCYLSQSSSFDETIDTFINNSDYYNVDYLYLYKVATNGVGFCFGYDDLDQELCFDASVQFSNDSRYSTWVEDDIGIIVGTTPVLILQNNSSFFQFSPLSFNGGGNSSSGNQVGMTLSSTGSSIYYYETQLGFNKDICYVGVNSMSTLYGISGISFNQGGGLSIFEAFESLYGNTDLDKVYVWINNWLLNYEQWFGNDGNPMFLSNYNSGTNQVDIYYNDLTFPFANNPVAVYFMASYIEQVFANSKYDPSGSAVVSYCNMKINDGTFEEILDNADKVNINKYVENANINKGLNPDGTEKDYGAWLSSGVNIAFSGNTSIKDTLINFLDETEESIKSLKGNTGSIINGHILPSWLIGAFLFFALFKFIRKR